MKTIVLQNSSDVSVYGQNSPKDVIQAPMKSHQAVEAHRVLVLGSGGFLGRHLVSFLRSSGIAPFEVRGRADCDLTDYEAVQQRLRHISPDILIHLAASPDTKTMEQSSLNGFSNTVLSTLNIVRAARRLRCGLVIHVGSYKQYGNLPLPFREEAAPKPSTLYGLAKHLSEVAIRQMQDDGINTVCLRLGPVFGPGQQNHLLVARVIYTILTRAARQLTATDSCWDPIYVSDAVNAIYSAMLSDRASGSVINISGGSSFSPYKIMCLIAEIMDEKEITIIKDPQLQGAWSCLGDISLAKQLLGWMPIMPIRDALRITVDYYQAVIERNQVPETQPRA